MEESITLLTKIKEAFACEGQDVRAYSPLTLAYIGDGIYELVIRSVVVERANRSANDLHKKTTRYVKAPAQSAMIEALLPELRRKRKRCTAEDATPNHTPPRKTLPWQITAELPVLKH